MNYYTYKKKQDGRTLTFVSSDCYVRFDRVSSPSFFDMFGSVKKLSTNIGDLGLFRARLEEMENGSSSHNGNHIYGVVLTFMLDKLQSDEKCEELVHHIVEKYDNFPYIAWLAKEGSGNYIKVYFNERHYYENGNVEYTYYKKDVYKSKKTKSFCSETDEDSCLYKKTGDIKSAKVVYFSKKTDTFRFKENTFVKFWNDLRTWFVDLLKKVCSTVVVTGITIRQYVYKKSSFKERRVAKVWNKAFKKMSDRFNDALTGLMYNGLYNNSNKNRMDNLYSTYVAMIENGYFNVKQGSRTFRLQISKGVSVSDAKDSSSLLLEKFNYSLGSLINQMYN